MDLSTDLLPAIVSFGPPSAPAGATFNAQPGGDAGLWLRLADAPPRDTVVVFGGTSLHTAVTDRVVTALVPPRLTRRAGLIPIWLESETADAVRFSDPVYFESVADAADLPAVDAFGPAETVRGQPFNLQADGQSWLWVRVAGRPPAATLVVFDGVDLPTAIDGHVVAAPVPPEFVADPRAVPVQLALDGPAGRRLSPTFVVNVV